MSNNITDLTLARGQGFIVQVNITDAVRLLGFDLILLYDQDFIEAQALDFKTDTAFGERAFVTGNSIRAGEVRVAAVLLRLPAPSPPGAFNGTGVLVHITFRVKEIGVSPLGLTDVTLVQEVSGEAKPLPPPRTADGYFKNTRRLGPVAEFVSKGPQASSLTQGDRVTFNATLSRDPDNPTDPPSLGIQQFHWVWGDLTQGTTQEAIVDHTFLRGIQPHFGDFWVRLTVVDYEGFKGLKIQVVHVSRLGVHDIAVAFLEVLPSSLLPGVNVTVRVAVQNFGTFQETYDLTVLLEGREIVRFSDQSILEETRSQIFAHNITTSGLPPRLYGVEANVTLIGATDENPRNNSIIAFFTVTRSSAGLLTFFIAGISFVGTGVGIGVFLKRRRRSEVY